LNRFYERLVRRIVWICTVASLGGLFAVGADFLHDDLDWLWVLLLDGSFALSALVMALMVSLLIFVYRETQELRPQ
jgi:hypothetical protein